jgi:hypothetical protein
VRGTLRGRKSPELLRRGVLDAVTALRELLHETCHHLPAEEHHCRLGSDCPPSRVEIREVVGYSRQSNMLAAVEQFAAGLDVMNESMSHAMKFYC